MYLKLILEYLRHTQVTAVISDLIVTQGQDKVCIQACPGFCSMKQLRIFLPPLDGMLVHCRVTFSSLVPISTPGKREAL